MKILLAATSTEDFSGASKCLLELASSLTRHGQEVVVSLPKVGGSIETALSEKNIPFVVMREYQCWYKEKNETPSPITTALKRVMNKITVAKCRKYLRIERFDIVHVNALTAYVVGKAAILENIPVVWHIREFMEEDLGISFVSREYSLELLNRATQFIAISQPICNKWSAQLQAPVTVVHDGVPVKDYYVDNNTVHETVKVLLYGRVVPGKGQLFYVQAAENILRNTSKPCTFYFAGKVEDEEYFNSCMQSIRQSGQENSIKSLERHRYRMCVFDKRRVWACYRRIYARQMPCCRCSFRCHDRVDTGWCKRYFVSAG